MQDRPSGSLQGASRSNPRRVRALWETFEKHIATDHDGTTCWQTNGKWYAIQPMLRRDPELGGHDGV